LGQEEKKAQKGQKMKKQAVTINCKGLKFIFLGENNGLFE
jgi:hypothetical protein